MRPATTIPYWTCEGRVRGICGIRHRTEAAAVACCKTDNRAVKRGHGPRAYSDRVAVLVIPDPE